MKKRHLFACLFLSAACLFGSFDIEQKAAAAPISSAPEEWSHPSGFKFWLPDNWKVKEDGDVLIASGPDAEIYFFVPKNSRSLDRSLDELEDELGEWLKNVKYAKPVTSNVGGIAEAFISGTGKDRKTGDEMEFDLGIYEKKGKILMVFGATPAENFDRYDKVFRKVVNSIK